MAEWKVLITDRAWPDFDVESQLLDDIGATIIPATDTSEAELVSLAGPAHAIMTCWAQVTAPVIEAASSLRIVARYGIGLDNISVDTATQRGIPVTYVPDYCVGEVSDHALALLLACARNIAHFHTQLKSEIYDLKAAPTMKRLSGQILGLVGMGRIAQALAIKARTLGLEVVATSPTGNNYGTPVQMVSLDTLLRDSDFISLHVPLNEQTHHLIDKHAFHSMKRSAYLINTSRGPVIDQSALEQALENKQIAGAALDVFDVEPPDLSTALFKLPNLVATPHAAFWSEEALHELRFRTTQQVVDLLSGRTPEHVVNPHVLNRTNDHV